MRRNVLVSGATRGLGNAIAHRLADSGYHLIGTGRGEACDTLPGDATYAQLDLAEDGAQISRRIHEIVQDHGELWGLVNNAAIGLDGVLATMHDSEIESLVRVNVTGTLLLTKYCVRSMLAAGAGGRIVNLSSIVSTTGFSGLAAYGATKAAMVGMTRSLAREVGRAGILVNAVSPGFVETDMSSGLPEETLLRIRRRSPLRRLVTPEEVAAVVAHLIGAGASGVTGTVSVVDAGSTA